MLSDGYENNESDWLETFVLSKSWATINNKINEQAWSYVKNKLIPKGTEPLSAESIECSDEVSLQLSDAVVDAVYQYDLFVGIK